MSTPHGTIKAGFPAIGAFFLALSCTALASDSPDELSPDSHHYFSHLNDNAWINEVGSLLYSDPDADGFFSGISLSIDVDSSSHAYEVYLVVDIIDEFNRAELLHTTFPFDVYGRSSTDDYRVEIDLLRNYAPAVYDLHLTLLDAHTDRVLDQVTGNEFRNLRSLPLESEDNQSVHVPVHQRPVNVPNDDIRVTEYAGSAGIWLLLFASACGLSRVFIRRPHNAVELDTADNGYSLDPNDSWRTRLNRALRT